MSEAIRLALPAPLQVDLTLGPIPVDNTRHIGVGTSLTPQDVLRFATENGFHHICQKDGFEFDSELRVAENLIHNPEDFFKFPAATILTPDDISLEREKALTCVEQTFNSSAQKRNLLETIYTYMIEKNLSQTLIDDVSSVADEFITNAVFNAPFIDIRTNTNPGLSRMGTDVKLDSGKSARILFAHNETELIVGCEDPYGSLNLNHYLNKIRTTYLRGPAATMNFGSGGAGLGSYIIFNAGSSLFFGVKKSRVTLLCCAIPLKLSFKKRVVLPKHLHVIQL